MGDNDHQGIGESHSPDGRLRARWRGLGCPDGMNFYEVHCLNTEARYARSSQETFMVQLVRDGGYLRRINRREHFIDATSVVLLRPGDEIDMAHPLSCGDVYSAIEVEADALTDWPEAQRWLRQHWAGTVDDRLDLEHRFLIAAARRGLDGFELTERVHHLLTGLLRASVGTDPTSDDELNRVVGRRPETLLTHRRLANQAREIITEDGFRLNLTEVAARLNCSPHHLSRVFRRTTGQHLTAYRNRMRIRKVLSALIEQGEEACLRTLAADYGFADQAHLTRTVGQHLGQSPGRLRRALSSRRAMAA